MALESSGMILYVTKIYQSDNGLEIDTCTHTNTRTHMHKHTQAHTHTHTEAHFISLGFLRKLRNKTNKECASRIYEGHFKSNAQVGSTADWMM